MQRREFIGSAVLTVAGLRYRATPETVEVSTRFGRLRGQRQPDGTRSFKGVPFARPPVGPLRFLPPQPQEPWNDVRDALTMAPAPIQGGNQKASSSEDCLYLNIWAPGGPGPYPVLVWIHGGGNTGGRTGDGGRFPRSGIVVVNLAYRLGALGFLELGELLGKAYADSGNNGLRDLVQGLRWVRDNIAAFGGDPKNVTIGGQSAGAKNVAALLGSPEASGLFHRAIMESGSGQTIQTVGSARDVAHRFGLALGGSPSEWPDRLRHAPALDLLTAQGHMSYPANFPFRAVTGGTFLPKRPVEAMRDGVSRDIPLLIGTNHDESRSFMAADSGAKPIDSHEVANAPFSAIPAMEKRYAETFPDATPILRRIRLLTAEEYWIPSIHLAEAHTFAGGKTYMYRFDRTAKTGQYTGLAVHGSEMAFTRGTVSAQSPKDERELAAHMHTAWIRFISGKAPGDSDGFPEWPLYDARAGRRTLLFSDDGISVSEDPSSGERQLWDNIL